LPEQTSRLIKPSISKGATLLISGEREGTERMAAEARCDIARSGNAKMEFRISKEVPEKRFEQV